MEKPPQRLLDEREDALKMHADSESLEEVNRAEDLDESLMSEEIISTEDFWAFRNISKPEDVLKLPSHLRKDALEAFQERTAKRLLWISDVQTSTLAFIEEQHKSRGLTQDILTEFVDKKLDSPYSTEEDRKKVDVLLYHFNKKYRVILREEGVADADLLSKCSGERVSESSLEGKYRVARTPFSFDFQFEKHSDYTKFVALKTDGSEREKTGVGMSYYFGEMPITASSFFSETIQKHEEQHKKFSAISIDTILEDSELERSTKDEIMAFYTERQDAIQTVDQTLITHYGFHETAGMTEYEYRKIILNAVGAIRQLEEIFASKDEVIGVLAKESLYLWPKVVERIVRSQEGQFRKHEIGENSIAAQGRIKQKEYNELYRKREEKMNLAFVNTVKDTLSQPIVLGRHVNKKGLFYAKIKESTILNYLRQMLPSHYSYKIKLKHVVLESLVDNYGDYSFSLVVGTEILQGRLHVKEF